MGISVHFVSQWPPPTVRARVRVCVWDLGVGHVDATSGCRDRQGESHFSNWGHHFHWYHFFPAAYTPTIEVGRGGCIENLQREDKNGCPWC